MTIETLKTKIRLIYRRMNGCTIEYDLSPYYTTLNQIKDIGTNINK